MRVIDGETLAALVAEARQRPRRRLNLNLHTDHAEPVQRMLNAIEPDSYIRPHRHPGQFELFVLVEGACVLVTFDDDGRVEQRVDMGPGGPRVLEIPAGTWHSLATLNSGSVVLEVKPGPFLPTAPEDFAAWAPPEGTPEAARLRDWLAARPEAGARWTTPGV